MSEPGDALKHIIIYAGGAPIQPEEPLLDEAIDDMTMLYLPAPYEGDPYPYYYDLSYIIAT